MKRNEFLEIIQNGESSKIEFKTEDVHPNALAEEIVAFANFKGGTIHIGVDDAGAQIGCTKTNQEELTVNVCRNNVRPPLIPIIENIVIDGKHIISVTIPEGDTAYSTNRGLYYIRVGSTKQVPTQQELLRLFQKRNMLQIDETPVLKASLRSIDTGIVNAYLAKLGQSPLNDESDTALTHELINLSILVEVDDVLYPSLAGILAFGKTPQKYFPSYTIQCGAYNGRDMAADAIREKDLAGPLDALIEDAIAFLKLIMPQTSILERGIQRIDRYTYPLEALREAIVNAVCHRDYTISGSAIRLLLFDNRLEIRSPGGLPNALNEENMLYRQFTRNQMIASFLTGYGYMERRGKGMLRMIKSCKENNIDCEFYQAPDKNEFIVTFGIEKTVVSGI